MGLVFEDLPSLVTTGREVGMFTQDPTHKRLYKGSQLNKRGCVHIQESGCVRYSLTQ